MDCPGCGFTNRSNARFCVHCGYQMAPVPFRIFDTDRVFDVAPGDPMTPLAEGTWVAGRFRVVELEAAAAPQTTTLSAPEPQNIYLAEDRSVCPACGGELGSAQLYCDHCGQNLTGEDVAWAVVRLLETPVSPDSLQPNRPRVIKVGERQYSLIAATPAVAPPVLRVLPALEKNPVTSPVSAPMPGIRIVGEDSGPAATRLLYGTAGSPAPSVAPGSLIALALQVEQGPVPVAPIALFSLVCARPISESEPTFAAGATQEHLANQILSGALLASVIAPALEGDLLDDEAISAAVVEAFVEAEYALRRPYSGQPASGHAAGAKSAMAGPVQVALVLIVHGKLFVAQAGNAGTSLTAWDHRQMSPTNLVVLTQEDIPPLGGSADPASGERHEIIGPFPLGIGQRVILASRNFWETVPASDIVEVLLSHPEPQPAAEVLAAKLPEGRVVVIELAALARPRRDASA